MRYRILIAVIVAIGVFNTSGAAKQRKCDRPSRFAYNSGYYDSSVEKSVQGKSVEVLGRTASDITLRHVYLESFGKTQESTRDDVTLFAICDSTFRSYAGTRSGVPYSQHEMDSLMVEFIWLDHDGKMKTPRTSILSYHRKLDENHKKHWTVSSRSGKPGYSFHNSLSERIKSILWTTSGFLYHQTGPIVDFTATSKEIATGLSGALLDLLPSVFKSALGKIVEYGTKELSKEKLVEWARKDGNRWGWGTAIHNSQALENAAYYEKQGKGLWKNSRSN